MSAKTNRHAVGFVYVLEDDDARGCWSPALPALVNCGEDDTDRAEAKIVIDYRLHSKVIHRRRAS